LAKRSKAETAAKSSGKAQQQMPENSRITVSGRWLGGAVLATVVGAALFAYATLCILFYQGQWQLVLHPAKAITATPASRGLKFDDIHFDYTETGAAQLAGWWIPADGGTRWSQSTLLYLHDGHGSLSDYVEDLATLHSLSINVFAFDYRGFGRSAGARPLEKRMTEDANAAWIYLTDTRHIEPKAMVIYGTGIGASLAAELAAKRAPAGLILDGPSEPAWEMIGKDARAKILPLGMLLTERFDPAETLKSSGVPKLFLDRNGRSARTEELYRLAAFPKEYFELKPGAYEETVRRFLDEVLP
jgi:uncharacterized protein